MEKLAFDGRIDHENYTIVFIDPQRLDLDFKKAKGYYVGPRGVGGINGRYEGFLEFLENPPFPIELPIAFYRYTNQSINFVDGRHRFAVLRDLGYCPIPVKVAKKQENLFKQKYGKGNWSLESSIKDISLVLK